MPEVEIAQDTEAPPDDSWRSHLSASMDRVETVEAPAAAPASTEAKAAPVEPAPEVAKPEAQGDRPRDDKGRFRSGEGTAPPKPEAPAGAVASAVPIGGPQTSPPAAPVPSLEINAPQSWKAEVRELAKKLPAEFRPLLAEAVRVDREVAKMRQSTMETQRTIEPLLRVVQPHLQGLQARGLAPAQVISNMLQTEQALAHPDERVRAKILHQAMQTYRVGVEALAAVIDGTPAAPAQAVDPTMIARQAAELVRSELGQQRSQIALQNAQSEYSKVEGGEWGEFLSHPDYGDPIKLRAAAILEADAQGGVDKGLNQAIEEACWAIPEIRKVLQQREASKQAATSLEATQRARVAASSVRSSPTGPVQNGQPSDDSWRAHLEAAFDRASGKV
jgi:hypothetical protein